MNKAFEDTGIHIRQKFPALWLAVMFCYIDADILGLDDPGNRKYRKSSR